VPLASVLATTLPGNRLPSLAASMLDTDAPSSMLRGDAPRRSTACTSLVRAADGVTSGAAREVMTDCSASISGGSDGDLLRPTLLLLCDDGDGLDVTPLTPRSP
jgi:hypothetical protein